MKNIILLDLDGVLITTPPWRKDDLDTDGYSVFNIRAVNCFNALLRKAEADVWLSSSRRTTRTQEEFNTIFHHRNIECNIAGYIPLLPDRATRLEEINAFLASMPPCNYLILDDDSTLQGLEPERKKYWIQIRSLVGFDQYNLEEAGKIIEGWDRPGKGQVEGN